jgi:D-3-phosphoglycerate dehydrogenase
VTAAGGWRVAISERLGPPGPAERPIEDAGAELVGVALWTEPDIIANGADADILVVGASEPFTSAVLQRLTRVKGIVRRGVGVDNIDVAAATELGISVAYVPDASVQEVSDHALALMLTLERRLPAAAEETRRGDPAAAGQAVGSARRFGDLTLGVLGFGRIGRALAGKAQGVMHAVQAHDPFLAADVIASSGVRSVSLDDLLTSSDIISLHLPSTPDTRSIVDATALGRMRAGSLLVNTARGELVDEDALVAALESGHLAGAALDVTTSEPLPVDSPLWEVPNLLLTGHTAAKGQLSGSTLRQAVVSAVLALLNHEAPAHLADPSVMTRENCRLATGR